MFYEGILLICVFIRLIVIKNVKTYGANLEIFQSKSSVKE